MVFSVAANAHILLLGTDRWLPYENLYSHQDPGFSVEVIRAVFARMGQSLSIRQYPRVRAESMIHAGRLDGVLSTFYSEELAAKCYFPREPLIQERWVLYVRKRDMRHLVFRGLSDFSGRVGVVRGASVSLAFWSYVRAQHNYDEANEDVDNFHKLVMGRVDYVVAGQANGAYLILHNHWEKEVAQLPVPPLKRDNLYLAFSKDRFLPEQVEAFSKVLHDFKKTAEFQRIYQKYFSRQGPR